MGHYGNSAMNQLFCNHEASDEALSWIPHFAPQA